MTQVNPHTIKNIAIIGAGPSGLATAKYLKLLLNLLFMIAEIL